MIECLKGWEGWLAPASLSILLTITFNRSPNRLESFFAMCEHIYNTRTPVRSVGIFFQVQRQSGV
jgi:hypothetical protein